MNNPWAICTASVGRSDTAKYERCVQSVKLQKNDAIRSRRRFQGIPIAIEWPAGSTRSYPDSDFVRHMKVDYGYVEGTNGADGEELDVYVGPHDDATHAYIVAQLAGEYEIRTAGMEAGQFDEWKVMLGFSTREDAVSCFLDHMTPAQLGPVIVTPMHDFKQRVLPYMAGKPVKFRKALAARTLELATARLAGKKGVESVKKSMALAAPGELVPIDVNDMYYYGDTRIPTAPTTFVSADDVGTWTTVPRLSYIRGQAESQGYHYGDGRGIDAMTAPDLGVDKRGLKMNKAELFEAIRGARAQDDDVVKAMYNNPATGRARDDGNAMNPRANAPIGQNRNIGKGAPATGDGRFDDERRAGMPSTNDGTPQTWSADDTPVMDQFRRDTPATTETTPGAEGSARTEVYRTATQNKDPNFPNSKAPSMVMTKGDAGQEPGTGYYQQGFVQYHTGQDAAICKAMGESGLSVEIEPTLGRPGMPLTMVKACIGCDDVMTKALTTCPSCGTDQLSKGNGAQQVIVDMRVANRLRSRTSEEVTLTPDYWV